mmetsp:Transcript_51581/g.125801  ORF Transcript_51581/g.125801 Transcript_51581/m.125801 type:complete len:125 (+) Transcript_51581:292-666(+)
MWPFSRLKRWGKTVNVGAGVEATVVGVREVTQSLASLPGVGLISVSVNAIRKSYHPPSTVTGPNQRRLPDAIPSTLSRNALVKPTEELSVTELRLSPEKDPVCIVLSEDIECYIPCKHCRRSRD